MAPSIPQKRKPDDTASVKLPQKSRKQHYHSSPSSSSTSKDNADEIPTTHLAESSEDEDARSDTSIPSMLQEPTAHGKIAARDITSSPSPSSNFDSDTDSEASSAAPSNPNTIEERRNKTKRNDPTAFASSISAILGSKLTTSKRADPVLSRSATAAEANTSIADSKLEVKARQKLKEDKKQAQEKGRVKDVLLGTDRPRAGAHETNEEADGEQSVGEMMEQERRLRKTAQKGVVKLFNAVRQAQVKAEEARAQGGSRAMKQERVGEMTKKGFLEMVAAGGGSGEGEEKMEGKGIEEA